MTAFARVSPLTGTQRVALLLTQLDREHAADVLRQFSDDEAERVSAELMALSRVDAEQVSQIVDDFYALSVSGAISARGGRDVAAGLLEATFGAERAAGVMSRLTATLGGRPFEFMDDVDPATIRELLENELAQTTALVLAHLSPQRASQVLAGLPEATRLDVVESIAHMGSATPEAVAIVADALRHRAGAVIDPRRHLDVVGGVQPLVEIITRSDVATERALLAALDERSPELAEEIRSRLVTFMDLVRLSPRDVQLVLRGIDPATLALALRGASETITATIVANISERVRALVDEEASLHAQVRASQVDEARAEIVRAMREAAARGDIVLSRADDEGDRLV